MTTKDDVTPGLATNAAPIDELLVSIELLAGVHEPGADAQPMLRISGNPSDEEIATIVAMAVARAAAAAAPPPATPDTWGAPGYGLRSGTAHAGQVFSPTSFVHTRH
ncbi:acyl-CoA carboxylase subunit epsilon [Rhodococcus rhodnii]|uniref:Acyl-CoA carboxylase subunit epsilon n=2 Tax=Rhodococcus rhodnii TaxID=38312 RepID=R7WGS6_9NOCA|nr:acyl-CoA carboxylase epsilon subunit [Rhodococcus rhodnii]EOM74263.1 hypothetical protein Rrhod_4407 [Rhodococcus rhodnii LMG 5362]TXG89587.1 acyl-CoA carboxylase subunit epsilon [Rhodococcus rhodnii]